MASEDNFGTAGTEEVEEEPSPTETPPLSAPDELRQSAGMNSLGFPGQGERAPCGATMPQRQQEQNVQPGSDGHKTKQVPPVSSKRASKANGILPLGFPQKLWKMLESGQFRSIWWSNGGKYVAINEDLFKEEVLGLGRPVQVFAMQSVKSFVQQLNRYGFRKIHQGFDRAGSLTEFLAEEAAASTHSKVLYFYNPSFNRQNPHLLEKCKRRVRTKQKALNALKMYEEHPSKSRRSQPAEGEQASPTVTAPLTVQQAKAPQQHPSFSTRSFSHTSRASAAGRDGHPSGPLLSTTTKQPTRRWPPERCSCSSTGDSAHAGSSLSSTECTSPPGPKPTSLPLPHLHPQHE